MRRPNWRPREKWFVQEFSAWCSRFGCYLVDIPDAIVSRGQVVIREKQRPADSVLITPTALCLIEFKVGGVTQSDHQRLREKIYNNINPNAYYVIRKWQQKRNGRLNDCYDIKQNGELVARLASIQEVVNYFKELL